MGSVFSPVLVPNAVEQSAEEAAAHIPRPDAALAAVGQGFICLHYSVSTLEHSKTAVRLRL